MHKNTLSNDPDCIDIDKIVYPVDASGSLQVVGIRELIRWAGSTTRTTSSSN